MPSYHISTSGQVVKCASDPCRLHGGSDFYAKNLEEAQKIGETLVESLYSDAVFGLTTPEERLSSVEEDKRSFVEAQLDNTPTGKLEMSKRYDAVIKEGVESGRIRPNDSYVDQKIKIHETIREHAQGLSREEATKVVDASPESYSSILKRASENVGSDNPSAQDMAEASFQLESERRSLLNSNNSKVFTNREKKDISRRAAAILNGRVNLNDKWCEAQGINRQAFKNKIKNVEEQLRDTKKYPLNSDERKKLIDQKNAMLRHITMPRDVRHNIMRTAWNNASDFQKRKILREGLTLKGDENTNYNKGDKRRVSAQSNLIQYASASEVATYLRHTKPSNKDLAQYDDPEERRRAVQKYKFARLEALYYANSRAFTNAIAAGALSDKDASAWNNTHRLNRKDDIVTKKRVKVKNDDGTVSYKTQEAKVGSQGENWHYTNTMRAANSITLATGVPQYNSREYTLRKAAPGEKKGSPEEKARKAYNRRIYAKNKAKVIEATNVNNFIDANGKYDMIAHARQLQQLPKTSLSIALTNNNIPSKTLTQYLMLEDKKIGSKLGHSRYHIAYNNTKNEVVYQDDNSGKQIRAQNTNLNHVNLMLIRATHGDAFEDYRILKEKHYKPTAVEQVEKEELAAKEAKKAARKAAREAAAAAKKETAEENKK